MARKALVIGNNDYTNIKQLKNPINDARTISRILNLKGFDVTLLENLKLEAFLRKLNEFGESVQESEELVLFYYAGHSVQLMDSNYLLPVDIMKDLAIHENIESGSVYLGDVTNALNKSNGEKIVILDACRSHDFTQEIIATNDIFNKGLCEIESSHGMAVIYSTQPGNTASDGTKGSNNGCFTEELSKNISQYGLTFSEVVVKTREAVLAKTNYKQIPWSSNSISRDFYLDNIVFPGDLIAEIELPSNGIDTISSSYSNVFISTQKRQLFIFYFVSNITSIEDGRGNVIRYRGGCPHMLEPRLGNEDYINEALFLNDDFMLGVSEKGYVYLYDIQGMLTEDCYIDSSGIPRIDYTPQILFDDQAGESLFCISSVENHVFVSGSSGALYKLEVSDVNGKIKVNSFDSIVVSKNHITSIACNELSGAICVSDEHYIYFIDNNFSIINEIFVRTSNILHSDSLGFVVASNDYNICFFDDVGQKIKNKVSLELKQHPLRDVCISDLYVTSLDIVDERYLVLGTNKPSILMYDTSLNSIVNEKFLDIHMTSPFYSSVYDLCSYQEEYLFSRSKLNHFGIWRLDKI
ncbi:caspase family protein [Halomonas sp. A40-4]|uniref:caspase family protein n=1 Tax=Halomonas sp. A40-4 TaxID=2785909 RepID=UPI0018EFD280|nr:caspase family protein [Halomonas sp. A40-4]QPL47113.1 caspase family protein [Halomonas sp. A40-4]